MHTHKRYFLKPAVIALIVATLITNGCNPATTATTVTALEAALNTLIQNRSLAEQFVRDVKTTTDPTDPNYAQVVEQYEAARDSYNHFLDSVELAAKTNEPPANMEKVLTEAHNDSADFLTGATRSLRPSLDTRQIPFKRAMVIPEDLSELLNKLPKSRRNDVISQFDNQVRWRSWRQL